jgi:hypothetical protein
MSYRVFIGDRMAMANMEYGDAVGNEYKFRSSLYTQQATFSRKVSRPQNAESCI